MVSLLFLLWSAYLLQLEGIVECRTIKVALSFFLSFSLVLWLQ